MIAILLLMAASSLDCREPATQMEMNDCALIDFNEADAQLNSQWRITFRNFQQVSPESAGRLRMAQRAWVAYRDAECDAEHPWDLGVSLDHGLNIMCRTAMTKDRTRKLAELAQEN